MKFRATTNSIRIRVRKSDLAQLADNGQVYETVSFPGGKNWTFALKIAASKTTAEWKEDTIAVSLARATAQVWINSEEVGIEEYLPLEKGEQLHLLVEKDFPCKTRDEDLSDTFFELDQGAC